MTASREPDLPLYTLDQESARIADGWDIPDGPSFADTVHNLHWVRGQLRCIRAVADVVRADLALAWEQGETAHEQWEVRQVKAKTSNDREFRVKANDVRKRHPRVWNECRIIKPHKKVMVTHKPRLARAPEIAVIPPQGLDGLYESSPHPLMSDIVHARTELTSMRQSYEMDEADVRKRLIEFAQVTGWDGLAFSTRDGWTIQTSVLEFDNETMKTRHPDLFTKMGEWVDVGARAGYLDLRKRGTGGFTGWRTEPYAGGGTQQVYYLNGEIQELGEIDGD